MKIAVRIGNLEKMGGGGITYKGVTVHTPKTWHTVAGKGLCGVMWYHLPLDYRSIDIPDESD